MRHHWKKYTTPSATCQLIKKHVDEKHGTHKALNDKQVISRVKNACAKINSNDAFRAIELGSASKMEDTDNWVLLLNHSMPDPKINSVEIIVGFVNPALLGLLSGKIDLCADASFCLVPKQFCQTLVIMAYDPLTGTRVPCVRTLMTGFRWLNDD